MREKYLKKSTSVKGNFFFFGTILVLFLFFMAWAAWDLRKRSAIDQLKQAILKTSKGQNLSHFHWISTQKEKDFFKKSLNQFSIEFQSYETTLSSIKSKIILQEGPQFDLKCEILAQSLACTIQTIEPEEI